MPIHAVDDIIGGEIFAVVPGDAFAQVERELGCASISLLTLGELGAYAQVVVELDKAVHVRTTAAVRNAFREKRRIQGVRRSMGTPRKPICREVLLSAAQEPASSRT